MILLPKTKLILEKIFEILSKKKLNNKLLIINRCDMYAYYLYLGINCETGNTNKLIGIVVSQYYFQRKS